MGIRSRSSSYMAVFGTAILIAGGVGWYLAQKSVDLPRTGAPGASYEAPVGKKQMVHLYFGDHQGRYLSAEQRIVAQPADVAVAARRLVQALIQGPEKRGARTLPQEPILRSLFVTGEGVAYVDFAAGAFDHYPASVKAELLSIYSIVNTLVLNVEEIRRVKFLVGGQEAATLAGHVDLSHPFKADMLWVR